MREKEEAADYRFCPHPEIPPVVITEAWLDEVRRALPETAGEKHTRLTGALGLSDYDAGVITASRNLSRIFDEVTALYNNPKETANWIIVELLSIAKGNNKGAEDIAINTQHFAKLIRMVDERVVNRNVGKSVLVQVLQKGAEPEAYIKENGLAIISDAGEIKKAVQAVLEENNALVQDYKNGNTKLFGSFVGKAMKALGGKADPKLVNELLKAELGEETV
jgi:aspartyl-tRNA(Asn)/glutamyl-tRNA(Gln) amidotransferase subunit B